MDECDFGIGKKQHMLLTVIFCVLLTFINILFERNYYIPVIVCEKYFWLLDNNSLGFLKSFFFLSLKSFFAINNQSILGY